MVGVLTGYILLGRRWRWQNLLLLAASYVFYGYWDWRFLGLLFGLTAVNYCAGWAIGRLPAENNHKKWKKLYLGITIVISLGVLGIFKYFSFFDQSLVNLLSQFGMKIDLFSLKIILPLGISFFTFMAITYPFDIYRGRLVHTKNFLDFALFVSFFPTIVSGPVERASHMLPQFQTPRQVTSEKIDEGLWLIIWGFFQKLVIADNLGLIVNRVFDNYQQYQGVDIIIAILAYTVQILADFGGYTDIARGVARLFGFDLFLNFNVPYFALNPSDFWSRWHISLSQWFRDYLYIPLGGNRKGKLRTSVNIFITMVLVGLWHGAAWTFILWGAWHGLLQIIYRLFGQPGLSTDRSIKNRFSLFGIVGRTLLMLILVGIGWTAFRSTSFGQLSYLFTHLQYATSDITLNSLIKLIIFSLPMIIMQVFQLVHKTPVFFVKVNPWLKGLSYACIICAIIFLIPHNISRFIYQGF
jgi:alginate O-acetyltransferase complex protein AlgI